MNKQMIFEARPASASLELDGLETFDTEQIGEEWEGETKLSPDYVRWVQQSLNRIMGLWLAMDGMMGPAIRSAIRSFQKQQGLPVNGIVGPETERALQIARRRMIERPLSEAEAPLYENWDTRSSRSLRYPFGKGMWIGQVLRGSDTPQAILQKMRAYGLTWLVIPVTVTDRTGRTRIPINRRSEIPNYRSLLRDQLGDPNFGVWLWAWSHPDWPPRQEVEDLIRRAVEVGAQGVVLDVEGPWKWRAQNPTQERTNRARAAELMNQLLSSGHSNGLSVGVTVVPPFGAEHRNFPWAEFAQADFVMPQIYERQVNRVDSFGRRKLPLDYPTRCVEALHGYGISNIMPISNAFDMTSDEMGSLLLRTPVPSGAISWWMWRGANMRPERWAAIARYRIGETPSMYELSSWESQTEQITSDHAR
jgi:hypothetical protein